MAESDDPYNLHRFVEAQNPVIEQVKKELRSGSKQTHWMWFVFPQVAGLGKSRKAKHYAISSSAEAEAYLEHPILGTRLRDCTEIVNNMQGRSANDIFGSPDDLKFQSCMTLFDAISDDPALFRTTLQQYYDNEPDQRTVEFLSDD